MSSAQPQSTGHRNHAGQAAQLQRIDAVGQVAHRIAHNFSNMLAAAIGGLNLIERRLKKGETDPEILAKYAAASMDGATRALALTQRLLEFSREPPLQAQTVDCNSLIQGLAEPLRDLCGAHIQLVLQPAADTELARADFSQSEQALLNLARNGCSAMSAGGVLTIGAATRAMGDEAALAMEIEPGRYIVLTVADTGTGMAPEILGRAIEPLFTTGDAGKGFGLGLTEAFRFARRSNGHLRLRSDVGAGTVAELFLPAI